MTSTLSHTTWLPEDLRARVAEKVATRRDSLVVDLEVLVTTALPDSPSGDMRARLVTRMVDLFVTALAGGGVAGHPAVAELALVQEAGLAIADMFAVARLAERCLADELSLDGDLGATSGHWPAVVESLRTAAFDVLAAYAQRNPLGTKPWDAGAVETQLVTRRVFEMALDKELHRAIRFRQPLAVILFEIDDLSGITHRHGYAVGDMVLERLGVFMHQYFRQDDWAGVYRAGCIAVLLPQTSGHDAEGLAEGVRQAIQERLVFPDKDDHPVAITVSASVVTVTLGRDSRDTVAELDAKKVMTEADAAIKRAAACGGNTVERVEVARASLSITEAASFLHCGPKTVRKLIDIGTLPAVDTEGRVRIDRVAVEAYARRQMRRRDH